MRRHSHKLQHSASGSIRPAAATAQDVLNIAKTLPRTGHSRTGEREKERNIFFVFLHFNMFKLVASSVAVKRFVSVSLFCLESKTKNSSRQNIDMALDRCDTKHEHLILTILSIFFFFASPCSFILLLFVASMTTYCILKTATAYTSYDYANHIHSHNATTYSFHFARTATICSQNEKRWRG